MITDIIEQIKQIAKSQALYIRENFSKMTDTEIIENEICVPFWNNEKDYTNIKIGTPVRYEEQIYTLLQPHNASYYPNTTPAMLPALWRVKHTTNPLKAKPWVKPTSTSDMYLKDECMLYTDGLIYYCVLDNGTIYSPEEYSPAWKVANIEFND